MAIMNKKAYASLLEKERQRRGRILFVVTAVQFVCLFALSSIQLFIMGVSPYILIPLCVMTALTASLGGAQALLYCMGDIQLLNLLRKTRLIRSITLFL